MTINYVYFYCALQGDHFDPIPFLGHDRFEVINYHRVGELAEEGRFKGQIRDDGYVSFKAKAGDFDEFVNRLYVEKELIIENRIQVKELHVFLAFEGQCNWAFDPDILRMIGELDLTLTISCAQMDNFVNS